MIGTKTNRDCLRSDIDHIEANVMASRQQSWNEANPEVIKKAQENYNQKRPVWSFRPTPENLEWLEEERWDDEDGKPESNAQLLNRKLDKLRWLEQQGF